MLQERLATLQILRGDFQELYLGYVIRPGFSELMQESCGKAYFDKLLHMQKKTDHIDWICPQHGK